MEEKQQLTTEEKRKKKIAQLKAQLQKEESRLNKDKRKERDGQLIAFGVMVEENFKKANELERQKMITTAKINLIKQDRNLARALAGFERLKNENPIKKEEPSAVSTQLPPSDSK